MSETPAAFAARLNDLRQRVLADEEVSPEEYRAIIDQLRAQRVSASRPPAKGRAKNTSTSIDPDSLVPDLL